MKKYLHFYLSPIKAITQDKKEKLKKVIITTSNNLFFDNRVHKITLALIELGFEVLKTGREFPRIKNPKNRPGSEKRFRLPFNKGPLFYLFLNIYTFWFLIFTRFNLIWAVDMDTLPGARFAAIIRRKPVVFDGHEYFSELPELANRPKTKGIWVKLEKTFLPGCNLYYTVSPGLVNLYKQNLNLNFKLLRNFPIKQSEIKGPILEADEKIILYQGVLNTGRGLEQAIKALSFLEDSYRLVIVGRGDITADLKQLTKSMNLERRVIFTGAVPFEELHRYQDNAMLGLALHENMGLNYYHALPNRIFDYIQAGIPVLANDFPDMAEIINNSETGLIINSLEPEIIASTIKEACESTELRRKWLETIPLAAKRFTWDNEKEELRDVLQLV